METLNENETQKKDPFESLSKEELMKKCKHLLVIAQKAKQVKDDITEENKSLTNALTKLQNKSRNDMSTMQEMVDTLTEQKLQLVTETSSLETKFKEVQKELVIEKTKAQNLEVENEGLHRQVKRLSEENDQLITHLDVLEKQINELNKIGEQQREELLVLEERSALLDSLELKKDSKNVKVLNYDKVHLENQIKYLENQVNELTLLNKTNKENIQALENNLQKSAQNFADLQIEFNNEKQLKDKYNDKLKSHHSKLIKVFSDVKELKQNRQQLLVVVQEYATHINRWQKEIENVSKKFTDEITSCKEEIKEVSSLNENLKKCNADLVNECAILKQNADNNRDNNNLSEKILELTEVITQNELAYHKLLEENVRLEKDYKKQIKTIKDEIEQEKNKFMNEVKNLKEELSISTQEKEKITQSNIYCNKTLKKLTSDLEQVSKDLDQYKNEIKGLDKAKTKLEAQIESFKAEKEQNIKIKTLNKELSSSNQVLKISLDATNFALNDHIKKLETERNLFTNKIQEFLKEMDTLKIQNVDLQSANKKLQKEVDEITKKQNDSEKINQSNEIINLKTQITNLETENKKIQKDFDEVTKKLNDFEKLSVSNEKIQKELLESLESENGLLKNSLQENETVNLGLKETNKGLEKDKQKLLNTLEKSKKKIEEIKQKLQKELVKQKEKEDEWAAMKIINQEQKENLLKELKTVQEQNEALLIENNKFKIQLEELVKSNDEITAYRTTVNDLNLQLEKLTLENHNLTKQQTDLDSELNKYNNTIKVLENHINNVNENKNLQEENLKLQDEILTINKSTTDLTKEIDRYNQQCSDLQNQITLSKRENIELLKEMNDMNQALKERGETISKQQEVAQELLKKLQNSEQEAVENKQHSEKLEEELKGLQLKNNEIYQQEILDKDEKIKLLEQEIQQLKDSLQNPSRDMNDDCRDSEIMSTSSVSRLDESARLRDLEGSWEERYTKLRTLALKLKGKVKELTEQLNQERSEKTEIQNKNTNSVKNLQTMQVQLDNLQDEHDILISENKDNFKKIESLISENDKNKKLNVSLQEEIEMFKKVKEGGDSTLKQFQTQIQNLKSDFESSVNKNKELENQISNLKTEIQNKHEEVLKEAKAHNETKEMLHKSNNEKSKKKSVLSLEMEALEKSLKETVQKSEKKDETVKELERKLNEEKDIVASLKEQTHILEERIMSEESNSSELEFKILENIKKISELEFTITQKETNLKDTIQQLETSTITNEELNTQLAQIITQNQKQVESLKTDKEFLRTQAIALEEKVKDLTSSLKDRSEELKQIQEEYTGYKIRAQSVLKQGKTRDLGAEERLNEEVTNLQSQLESTTSELNVTNKKLDNITSEYDKTQMEIKKLTNRTIDLEKQLKKETENNKKLTERQQQLINEHKEQSRVQKVHVDTLVQCYKQQLSDLEEKHIKELTDLKSQPIEECIDISFMKREDAEGSESIESISNNITSKNQPLALDKLLSMDADLSTTSYEAELQACKQVLLQQEAKVGHLTELLADTEQDLAKHAQLNQILKEEIRRQQRSVEREKHAENLEYLKNVVFKFITLQSSDERTRLVPVLTTILKLSPEETNKLNTVAKGADSSQRGWGSYLPAWPGVSGGSQQ